MVIEACPRRCWTSFGWTPRFRSRVAQGSRRACQRMSGQLRPTRRARCECRCSAPRRYRRDPNDPVRTLAPHLSEVKGKGQVNNSVQRGCGLLRGNEYVVVEVRFLDGKDRLFWPRDLEEVSSTVGIC